MKAGGRAWRKINTPRQTDPAGANAGWTALPKRPRKLCSRAAEESTFSAEGRGKYDRAQMTIENAKITVPARTVNSFPLRTIRRTTLAAAGRR